MIAPERRCLVCNVRPRVHGWFCVQCNASYDRAQRRDDGTVLAAMLWAAKRARRFAQRDGGAAGPSRRELRAMVETLLRSATPHPVEHPSMWRAWGAAAKLLGLPKDFHRIGRSE